MEQRLANTWRMTVNEKKFIETALLSDLRVDGRRPFDYRKLTIKFGREDGSSEVQLGETHVMGYVTSQLVQPYRDRPNEGTLAIFTEFSPMADPSFEAGRPGESAVELGRVIDRGLRESRAVDMESLCVVAGKSVWAIRVDLHILDNGGNLIDAANIAALAALLTFQRPECTLGGENGQEVIVHDPEVREPLPLIVHHLPVAVTFAIFDEGNIMVIDPTYKEEAVMGGRMTATLNSNGDVCAVQKAGGEGVMSSVIMQCLRIASVKAADITSKIKDAVDAYNTERALRKVKRHPPSVALEVSVPDVIMKENQVDELSRHRAQNLKDEPERSCSNDGTSIGVEISTSRGKNNAFIGGPSSWDPYSKGISSCFIRSSQDLPGPLYLAKEQEEAKISQNSIESDPEAANTLSSGPVGASVASQQANSPKSLKDAVKPKNRKKNKASSTSDMS
ncbi:exosome complex component RRP45A-like [Phoenix dactylifera]|uniref:Protein ECERIFERUM 7 n=1 Tax=Phoenix dactylifera TaxID=42345 RepID=A0A8B8ZWN3_PHODC|nr:exosome complex component RRP45A-like [Phoenix dactylifera]XP_038978704.1 exosome complex component RRP45A-like [Phoenix dactylifera]XP_038978705.1 exosome complex component RRP45A-like [Phoenix dactylifera]XP_038978706.1 exosome complex component RRP45A-like [Phoenix dactylifera]